jgi:hypothetical protein
MWTAMGVIKYKQRCEIKVLTEVNMKDTNFGNVSLSVWQKYILEEFNASIFSRLCLLLDYLALVGSTPKTTCDITQTDIKKK